MKLYPDDWRVRFTAGAVSAACILSTLAIAPTVVHGFWPLALTLVLAMIVGNVLGRLVCQRLFPPPAKETKDEQK